MEADRVPLETLEKELASEGFLHSENGKFLPDFENWRKYFSNPNIQKKVYPIDQEGNPYPTAIAELQEINGETYVTGLREGSWNRLIYHGFWPIVRGIYESLLEQISVENLSTT